MVTTDKPLPHELLLMYRQRSGLTQTQLSAAIGVKSVRTLTYWEGGYILPKADRLRRLIEFYMRHGTFRPNHARAEAQGLWESVKSMFDANSDRYGTYPVFDAGWFEQVQHEVASTHRIAPALSRLPHNLPDLDDPILGRQTEIARIRALLLDPEIRLVTLTGVGGTGKTRLALAVAHHLVSHPPSLPFKNGVYFVPLETIIERDTLIAGLCQTLKVKEIPGQSLLDTLKAGLSERQMVLVLDNFDQLITRAGSLPAELLQAAPHLKIVITSREVLKLSLEHACMVEPLAVPENGQEIASAACLLEYAATALFERRAQSVSPGFQLTVENSPAVIEICRKLDGLPLGIELAAAQVKTFTPQKLAERLNLGLLAAGGRDLPHRRPTVREALEWIYGLLGETGKRLLARLAIFSGGCTLEAANAVCRAGGDLGLSIEVCNGLESLLTKNLLKQSEGLSGETRYTMLQTIREFALEKLSEGGEASLLEAAHFEFFLELAGVASTRTHQSPRQGYWLDRLESELDNLRAALNWALSHRQWQKLARLSEALVSLWSLRAYHSEGRRWLGIVLAHLPDISEDKTGPLFTWAGLLAIQQEDYASAASLIERALATNRAAGDKAALIKTLVLNGAWPAPQNDEATSQAR